MSLILKRNYAEISDQDYYEKHIFVLQFLLAPNVVLAHASRSRSSHSELKCYLLKIKGTNCYLKRQ